MDRKPCGQVRREGEIFMEESETTVSTEQVDGGRAVVSVAGALDLLGATRLALPLMDALEHSVVVLDLGGCDFLDSSGLREVLRGMRRAEDSGHSLRLAGLHTNVLRVLELSGLLTTLELYPDVAAALKG
jgi:anti-anti-sigma factor